MHLATSLVALVLALLSPSAGAGTPTFGAGVGGDFVNQARGQWSAAETEGNLQSLYDAGGRVGRSDSGWAATEPAAPVHGQAQYDWSYADTVVGELATARLRWQPILDGTPAWAQQHGSRLTRDIHHRLVPVTLPPASNATFATYAAAFARRYGTHGSFWAAHPTLPCEPVTTYEVWNEEDEAMSWGPHVDLQDYARMYESVRSAIHRVQTGAQVMTGGLAWTVSSLPRLLKAFERRPVDAVAIHPYAPTPAGTVALARFAIAQLARFGRAATPLAANEYGWTETQGTWGSTPPADVDQYSLQALVGLARLRLAYVLPFDWAEPTWGLSDGTFARALSAVFSPS